MSARCEQPGVEGERDGAQERKDEGVKAVNEGTEMSDLELRTPKAYEAQDVHLPD